MAATMTAHKQLPSIVEYLDLPQFRRLVPDLPRATALCPVHIDRKIVPCRSTALRVDTQRHYLHFVRHFAPTVNGSDDAMKFKVRKAESIFLGKSTNRRSRQFFCASARRRPKHTQVSSKFRSKVLHIFFSSPLYVNLANYDDMTFVSRKLLTFDAIE